MALLGLLIQRVEILFQVAHAHSVAAYLICVSRADALARRSYLRLALGSLVGCIQQTVCRQYQMSLAGDVQARFQRMSAGFQRLCFSLEQGWVEHHAASDDIQLVALEDARRDGTKHIFLPLELQRMPRIRTALKTGYHVVTRRQHIHYLSFTFIAPLET